MRSLQVKNAPSSPPLSLIVPFSVEHSSYWTHLRFPCYSVSKTGVKSTTAGSCIPDVQLQAATGETTEWLDANQAAEKDECTLPRIFRPFVLLSR